MIFLKHNSDGFELKRQALLAEYPEGAEDPDEYLADNIFWVPQEARWLHLQASVKQPTATVQGHKQSQIDDLLLWNCAVTIHARLDDWKQGQR